MSLVIFTVTFGELMSGSGHPDTNIHDQRLEFFQRLSLSVVVFQCLILNICYSCRYSSRKDPRQRSKSYPVEVHAFSILNQCNSI